MTTRRAERGGQWRYCLTPKEASDEDLIAHQRQASPSAWHELSPEGTSSTAWMRSLLPQLDTSLIHHQRRRALITAAVTGQLDVVRLPAGAAS